MITTEFFEQIRDTLYNNQATGTTCKHICPTIDIDTCERCPLHIKETDGCFCSNDTPAYQQFLAINYPELLI